MASEAFARVKTDQFPTVQWGLLGPEQLAGSRRTRTLGLGAAVRKFNQLAVPGLGVVWFTKQIFLATLGVRVADRLRPISANVKAIGIANAVEALACWCAFNSNGWASDSRLRGSQKLAGKDNLTFARLRQPRFYVTQPMRIAAVLRILCDALLVIGVLLQPFMPTTMAKLLDFLAVPPNARDLAALESALTDGSRLPTPSGLFPRFVEPA